ncbi:MAG: hypothetical protein ACT4NY_28690 [Pseudonocardiales bacterium]
MSRAETALLAFTRQVLLRPTRIGTLALLGGMIAVVLVGAEGWWIVLGIILFHVAACTLTAMWITPRTDLPRQVKPRTNRVGNPPRDGVGNPPRSWVGNPPRSWVVNRVPRQRRPGPDE